MDLNHLSHVKFYFIVLVIIAVSIITQCSPDKKNSSSTPQYNQEAAALFYKAQQNYNNQKYITAIALVDSAIKVGVIKADLHFLKGLSLLKINQFDPAIQAFK